MVKLKSRKENSRHNKLQVVKRPRKKLIAQQNLIVRRQMPYLNMMERFVETISQANDSGTFDGSFEVKNILSPSAEVPKMLRHRCITELDREKIEQFVRDFEERQRINSQEDNNNNIKSQIINDVKKPEVQLEENDCMRTTPKSSPYLYRKAKAIYQNSWMGSRNTSPRASAHEFGDMQRNMMPERASLRSAARMLQFFATKKTKSPTKSSTQTVTSTDDDELNSSIDSSSPTYSNSSADTSFEMHPPLVPTFKVTPPTAARSKGGSGRNAASEFARFLRGSFHAKRAAVTTLRRSISDSQRYQDVDFTKPQTQQQPTQHGSYKNFSKKINHIKDIKCDSTSTSSSTSSASMSSSESSLSSPKANVKSKALVYILIDTTNQQCKQKQPKHKPKANSMRNQVIPTSASPFRRSWAQSSFHAESEDKVSKENIRNNNKLAAIPASMTASDNEVYLKSSMATTADFQKELKHALSQHQLNVVVTSAESQATYENNNNNNNEERENSNGLPDQPTTGPTAWATSFELLLEDAAGLQTFAEFLKKEFSAENIYFWAACKHYQQIENETERSAVAKEIFQKHLSNSATEPVNVDSKARTLTDETLTQADKSIFATAQKQIYNLMKFDSYPRFIRSELYNTCLRAEKKKKPLPFTGEDLDELLRLALNKNNSSKLKTSNSNAEDRRRKRLLSWHRKTRSKSRDRCDSYENNNNVNSKITGYLQTTGIRLPTLTTSGSLKIPSTTQNSMSDLHSSRSSLSSFDTLPSQSNGNMHDTSSLCRVILNDGATTVVPTRATETVGQMMDRLLEKRGLIYEHYDVLIRCNRKPVDLNSSARGTVAGKEVLIEKRVVFKIDLPDPKVISVKSKPNKLLNEVISQILLKYNYNMDRVQVMMGEKSEVLDLSLPVTVADGKRLQIVHLMQNSDVSEDNFRKPAVPSIKIPKTSRNDATFKGVLDEINNQVFDEVRKMRFEANNKAPLAETHEDCSLKSDDCASETSSIFDRIRRCDTNIPVFKMKSRKKSTSSQNSEDSVNKVKENHRNNKESNDNETKKPIIAKLKAGVKLQVTERVAEQQDELPEGSKRVQLTTDLNVDKPDALKIKDSISVAASKLRKVRANLSPLPKYSLNEHKSQIPALEKRPQPAPRLSIANKEKSNQFSSPVIEITDVDGDKQLKTPTTLNTSVSVLETEVVNNGRGPPPLPPKPKVLPMKPSNWTANSTSSNNQSPIVNKSIGRRSLEDDNCHNTLLEGKPSSFV